MIYIGKLSFLNFFNKIYITYKNSFLEKQKFFKFFLLIYRN